MNPANYEYRQLLSLIAHELRSPAAVVAGYLRLLLKNGAQGLPEPERKMIEEASRSCACLLDIVRELDDLADLEESGPSRSHAQVHIFSLCDEVVRGAVRTGRAVTFSCADIDRPALVEGDADRLKRALNGLVAAVQRERGARPLEAWGFVNLDNGARCAVMALGDAGIAFRRDGILASRGTSFDRWRGGTGMSLPIACRIVEAHGGCVWSLPDSPGACAVSLPLV
jgi:signal transduction histidine kinase